MVAQRQAITRQPDRLHTSTSSCAPFSAHSRYVSRSCRSGVVWLSLRCQTDPQLPCFHASSLPSLYTHCSSYYSTGVRRNLFTSLGASGTDAVLEAPTRMPSEAVHEQLGDLKRQLKASKGILDSSAIMQFNTWLGNHKGRRSSHTLSGRYTLLTSRLSTAGFGDSTSMINLCAVIGAQLSSQVKLLHSSMVFGASRFELSPYQQKSFARRDHIHVDAVGLEAYVYVPGVYFMLEDGFLEVRTRGFFLLPASNNARDLSIWKAWLKSANVGVDDLGNAGKHLANHEVLEVLHSCKGLVLLRSHNQQLHVLEQDAV